MVSPFGSWSCGTKLWRDGVLHDVNGGGQPAERRIGETHRRGWPRHLVGREEPLGRLGPRSTAPSPDGAGSCSSPVNRGSARRPSWALADGGRPSRWSWRGASAGTTRWPHRSGRGHRCCVSWATPPTAVRGSAPGRCRPGGWATGRRSVRAVRAVGSLLIEGRGARAGGRARRPPLGRRGDAGAAVLPLPSCCR